MNPSVLSEVHLLVCLGQHLQIRLTEEVRLTLNVECIGVLDQNGMGVTLASVEHRTLAFFFLCFLVCPYVSK